MKNIFTFHAMITGHIAHNKLNINFFWTSEFHCNLCCDKLF